MMRNDFYSPTEGKILAIDKPSDWTSFDVVNKIRRLTGIKKVGHAGTLDPFATGVLVICMGPATKKSSDIMTLAKEYVAELTFGKETDTMDLTGKFISEAALPTLTEDNINKTLASFLGVIEQEIPAYSAAKHKGKRLYKLARAGKEVPQLFKKVEVYELELLAFSPEKLSIRVLCGKGTYIRTLARDIARKLNSAGYVSKLRRTRVGDYRVEDAYTIESFQKEIQVVEADRK